MVRQLANHLIESSGKANEADRPLLGGNGRTGFSPDSCRSAARRDGAAGTIRTAIVGGFRSGSFWAARYRSGRSAYPVTASAAGNSPSISARRTRRIKAMPAACGSSARSNSDGSRTTSPPISSVPTVKPSAMSFCSACSRCRVRMFRSSFAKSVESSTGAPSENKADDSSRPLRRIQSTSGPNHRLAINVLVEHVRSESHAQVPRMASVPTRCPVDQMTNVAKATRIWWLACPSPRLPRLATSPTGRCEAEYFRRDARMIQRVHRAFDSKQCRHHSKAPL